jgi:hypothetical protein
MKTNLLLAATVWTVLTAPTAWAQRGIKVTPFIGGQINGGVDLSTLLYKRIDVQNGLNYGVSASYAIGSKYTAVEFMWNHNQASTVPSPQTEALTWGCSTSTVINFCATSWCTSRTAIAVYGHSSSLAPGPPILLQTEVR